MHLLQISLLKLCSAFKLEWNVVDKFVWLPDYCRVFSFGAYSRLGLTFHRIARYHYHEIFVILNINLILCPIFVNITVFRCWYRHFHFPILVTSKLFIFTSFTFFIILAPFLYSNTFCYFLSTWIKWMTFFSIVSFIKEIHLKFQIPSFILKVQMNILQWIINR